MLGIVAPIATAIPAVDVGAVATVDVGVASVGIGSRKNEGSRADLSQRTTSATPISTILDRARKGRAGIVIPNDQFVASKEYVAGPFDGANRHAWRVVITDVQAAVIENLDLRCAASRVIKEEDHTATVSA